MIGAAYEFVNKTIKVRHRAWIRASAVLAGGSGVYFTEFEGGQWTGPLAATYIAWTQAIGAYDNNNTLYDTGWREWQKTIPGGNNMNATMFAFVNANINGQTDFYKIEVVEHLLYAWIASPYRIIVSQANLWNVCPPEAL